MVYTFNVKLLVHTDMAYVMSDYNLHLQCYGTCTNRWRM